MHAYEEHGLDCVRHLNGIFAFALWDDREQRLVAARDAFGVKPLYWWTRRPARGASPPRSARCSRPGSSQPRGRPRRARPLPRLPLRARAAHAVRGRQQAAAGVAARGRGGRQPARDELARGRPARRSTRDDDELAAQLAERFTDAVERQMMSDVPYGAFLSGGVDSAGVVAAMKLRAATPPTTFTIGFPGHGDVLDERGLAAEIGAHRSAPTTTTPRCARPTSSPSWRAAMPRLEEPCGIPSAPGAAPALALRRAST